MVLIIGMAVGVDYSLFYLRREREERAAGAAFPGALAHRGRHLRPGHRGLRADRDGRRMAGLLLTGIDLFTGIAVGTIMVVGVAVVGSLTFLPALLSLLGPWADRGRIPFLGRRRTAGPAVPGVGRAGPPGGAQAAAVGRRGRARRCSRWPCPRSACALGSPAIDLPSRLPVVQTLDQIQRAFPSRPPRPRWW